MKKWMYLIFPTIMLVGFLVIYLSHKKAAEEKERARVVRVAAEKTDADAKKKIAEDKARQDAKKRQDERDAEEKKKEDDKASRQAADDKKVRDATTEYTAKAQSAEKDVKSLETELDRLRKEKDRLSRETFDMAKQVELSRIARRNAELEIQRMTDMIVKRAGDSSLTRPPIIQMPPPVPAKKA